MGDSRGPDWKGLLKWSVAQQNNGDSAPTREISEEDKKWFFEAMQAQSLDVVKRMKEITAVMATPEESLEAQGVSVSDMEGLLEELQEHVESIDMANDLSSVGGLVPLLNYLKSPHASLRARAAEVVATLVQNNPRSQQNVMEAHGLEYLVSIAAADEDATARTKALGAISSLIRHNPAGLSSFRLANGYGVLKDAMQVDAPKLQRKALQLLQYLVQELPGDVKGMSDINLPRVVSSLVGSPDGDVRVAALIALVEISNCGVPAIKSLVGDDGSQLKEVLTRRVDEITALESDEDIGAVREERQAIDVLWERCFEEPSVLRGAGLVVTHSDATETPIDLNLPRNRPRLPDMPPSSTPNLGTASTQILRLT